MSTVYLQYTVHSVGIPETGHVHNRAPAERDADGNEIPDESPTAIDCEPCEPYLVKNVGAVYKPSLVPLTERQIEAREEADREGGKAVRHAAEALAGVFAAQDRERAEKKAAGPQARAPKAAERPRKGGRFAKAGAQQEVRVVLADPD